MDFVCFFKTKYLSNIDINNSMHVLDFVNNLQFHMFEFLKIYITFSFKFLNFFKKQIT
jgi:hypothetical protein